MTSGSPMKSAMKLMKKNPKNRTFEHQHHVVPRPRPGRPRQLAVQVHQHEREDQRAQVRHVRRPLHQVDRQRQVQDHRDDDQQHQHERVVEPPRVALDQPAQPRAGGVGGVGGHPHHRLEDAELGAEQDEHAEQQGERRTSAGRTPASSALATNVGHVRRGRLLAGQLDGVGHQDRRQQHAEHRADEEDAPHVDEQQPVPAPPPAGVRRVVGERDADCRAARGARRACPAMKPVR